MGLQASGKSSFYLQQFYDTHIRLNLDMLKTRHREQLLFRACLTAKQPLVIVDILPTAKAGGFLLRDGNALPRECSVLR